MFLDYPKTNSDLPAVVIESGWLRLVSLATHPRIIPRSCCRICPIKLSSPHLPPPPDQILITGKLIFLPKWVRVSKQLRRLSGKGKLKSDTKYSLMSLADADYMVAGCPLLAVITAVERVETCCPYQPMSTCQSSSISSWSLSVLMSARTKPVISNLEIRELVLSSPHLSSPHSDSPGNYYHIPRTGGPPPTPYTAPCTNRWCKCEFMSPPPPDLVHRAFMLLV